MQLPHKLEKLVDELNANDDSSVNDYMPILRVMTSTNKHNIQLVTTDILIYLEAATLPFNTGVLLANDNLFYMNIGRYPVVLKCVVDSATEAVKNHNSHKKRKINFNFKQFPVLLVSDVMHDFPSLYVLRTAITSVVP